jgi:AcrR family transcriptional regulator
MRANKRDELLQKALTVFYENGFNATGMDMLVKETGISKTSMYKHFKTKDDLILATLRLRDELFRNTILRRMEELSDTPKGQVLALFDALGEWFLSEEFRGCMFIKASSEFQDPSHAIRRQSAEHKLLIAEHIQKLLSEADYDSADVLTRQLMVLKEGAIIAAHVSQSSTAAKDAKDVAFMLLDTAAS